MIMNEPHQLENQQETTKTGSKAGRDGAHAKMKKKESKRRKQVEVSEDMMQTEEAGFNLVKT